MPIYQFLSGATHYKMELPCDPTVYCRWRKHFGEAELEALIDSLGVVPRARYKHTIRHESVSSATKPQKPKAPDMQPFLPGFPQDND